MTDDGQGSQISETRAAGPHTGGPADVLHAAPAPHHQLTFLAAHPGRTGPRYRQRPGGAPSRPAQQSRSIRVPAGTRAREVTMV